MKKVFIVTHIWVNERTTIVGIFSEWHLADERKSEIENGIADLYRDEHSVVITELELDAPLMHDVYNS